MFAQEMNSTVNLNLLAMKHYENFPVGSFIIPKKEREALHYIYAFARVADDISDELNVSSEEKIKLLDEWASNLQTNKDEFFRKLNSQIENFQIPLDHFSSLIEAFKMDAEHSQPQNIDELLVYCSKSANPIGRIYLTIIGNNSSENIIYSDKLCTALQLLNFIQDLSIDIKKNRFYIPKDIEKGFIYNSVNLPENILKKSEIIKLQIENINMLLTESKYLIENLNFPFNYELSIIWHSAKRVIEKIEKINYKTFLYRPKLNWFDKPLILKRVILNK